MYPDTSAAAGQSARGMIAGAGQAIVPKQTPMQAHAQKLHDLSSNIEENNGRLANVLARLGGSSPEATPSNPNTPPRPDGVLYVAEFGAEKVGMEADKLRSLISRLESFI